jgi:hypothetical protein
MAAQEIINILERSVTGCRCLDLEFDKTISEFILAQADLENARNFLAKAAEQNLVCSVNEFLKRK